MIIARIVTTELCCMEGAPNPECSGSAGPVDTGTEWLASTTSRG